MRRRREKPTHPPTAREIFDLAEKLSRDAVNLERATRGLLCRVEPVEDLEERFVRGWKPSPEKPVTDRQLRDALFAAVDRMEWAMADIRLAAATLSEMAGDLESRGHMQEWIKRKD